jgi:hypothetical protein
MTPKFNAAQQLLALLIAAAFSPHAIADTYTINFNGDPGNEPTGSFTYNGTSFTGFTVVFQGVTFDLEPSANNPANTGCGVTGPAYTFEFMVQSPSCDATAYLWDVVLSPGASTFFIAPVTTGPSSEIQAFGAASFDGGFGRGSWSVSDDSHGTAAPEPIGLPLVTSGAFALALLVRNRVWPKLMQAAGSST